jgi:hypothetical protein
MLINIANASIYNCSASPQRARSGRHQATPTGRVKSLGLLDIHNLSRFIAVGKVFLRLWSIGIAHSHHLDRDGLPDGPVWPRAVCGGPHVDAIEESSVGILEFYQRISNLEVLIASWIKTLTYIARREDAQPLNRRFEAHCDGW